MVDAAWEAFLTCSETDNTNLEVKPREILEMPECSTLYISTKTIITYLNTSLNLKELFPKIPILAYHLAKEGVIKKTMKFNFQSQEELDTTLTILKQQSFYTENRLKKAMINPFKDIRKISIGLSNKDIISYRKKQKGAFYNCFVLILRIDYDGSYKECHVKLFNTGKVEIPGIKSEKGINIIKRNIIKILKKLNVKNVEFSDVIETVLINSNFNCGYCINRDKLASLLKDKYNLSTSYDPCSYPGIMCKYYYNIKNNIEKQSGVEPLHLINYYTVSFMIFRTGSILIVGKCTEKVLYIIYDFIVDILAKEYTNIFDNTKIITKGTIKRKFAKKQLKYLI